MEGKCKVFAIKAEVVDAQAAAFVFSQQKTMYGGKHVAKGDEIFVFASENEGGPGLIASGAVTSSEAIPRKPGVARQTPRTTIYRQATNKIVGISDAASAFLRGFF